jgi:hypothetical protein
MTESSSEPGINIPHLIYQFFGVALLVVALFYLLTPYQWQCELIGKLDLKCQTPHWIGFVIAMSAFAMSYFFFNRWDVRNVFRGKGI